MGQQHESSELSGGFSAAESAHHELLNQVLDDDRLVFVHSQLKMLTGLYTVEFEIHESYGALLVISLLTETLKAGYFLLL